jgi:hypothetical protein
MKNMVIILLGLLVGFNSLAQTNTTPAPLGLPGDNLNLYLVLNLFKQSASIEEFERLLNTPSNSVNNLDLNNDGSVDYIRVTDYGTGDYHTIILQDIISAGETQDVAIIDLQKKEGNMVHVQIIGDESLYGKNYIIEPQLDNTTAGSTAGSAQSAPPVVNNNYYTTNNYTDRRGNPYINTWSWPCVNFIFGTGYNPWVSPWHWAYYPTWWYARPIVIYPLYIGHFHDFGWNNYYQGHYTINKIRYNNYYNSHRVVSNTVRGNISSNVYKYNYGDIAINKTTQPTKDNWNNTPKQNKNNWNGTSDVASPKQGVQDNPKWQNSGNSNSSYKNKDKTNENDGWGGMNDQGKPKKEGASKPKWNNNNDDAYPSYKGKEENGSKNWGGAGNSASPSQNSNDKSKWNNNSNSSNNHPSRGLDNGSYKENIPKENYNKGGNSNKWNSGGGSYKGGGGKNGQIKIGTKAK